MSTQEVNKPNILIIMTDQHRSDLMSCAGHELVPTPNIDKIAERGVRFTSAYCPSPVCAPSRVSLLTGLYPHSCCVDNKQDRLDWRFRTIAHHFSDQGYLTALIGKMHFRDAHNHGFEYYMSINDWLMFLGPKVHHYANEIASHQHTNRFFRTVSDSGAGFPDVENVWYGNNNNWVGHVKNLGVKSVTSLLEVEDHLDMFLARESVQFIKRYKDQPFLLITSFMKPHAPYFPPQEFAEKYPIDAIEIPPVNDYSSYPEHIIDRIERYQSLPKQSLKAGRAGYLGNLAFVDSCVGYVYDALEQENLLDNTIVIYTSDHGEMDGTHGLWEKHVMFQPAVKVPLIISWPGKIPQNKVMDVIIEYFGIYPTLVELTGIPEPKGTTHRPLPNAPEKLDAHSFAKVCLNPDLESTAYAFAELGLSSENPSYMWRTNQFKFHHHENATDELYDLFVDPDENHNVINDKKYWKIAVELKNQLFEHFHPKNNPFKNGRPI